jgi:hypothetical protein
MAGCWARQTSPAKSTMIKTGSQEKLFKRPTLSSRRSFHNSRSRGAHCLPARVRPPACSFSAPRRNEILRCANGRVARSLAVNRRLPGLIRILFSDSCRGRRCRPVGSQRLPLQCPVFDVERLLAKAFGVGRLLRTAKDPYLDEKRGSSRALRSIGVGDASRVLVSASPKQNLNRRLREF